jgi:hypothetical protein
MGLARLAVDLQTPHRYSFLITPVAAGRREPVCGMTGIGDLGMLRQPLRPAALPGTQAHSTP